MILSWRTRDDYYSFDIQALSIQYMVSEVNQRTTTKNSYYLQKKICFVKLDKLCKISKPWLLLLSCNLPNLLTFVNLKRGKVGYNVLNVIALLQNCLKESEKHQINQLIYYLGNKADEILSTFQLTQTQAAEYETVKKKFDAYFDATKNVFFERAQFMHRVQQSSEHVDNFITCLHSLVKHCDYGTMKDEMGRGRLVVGLRDQPLSEHLQIDAKVMLKKE